MRLIAAVALASLLIAACSSDVTESEEYVALQAERDAAVAAQAESESQKADADGQLAEVKGQLEEVNGQLEAVQQELATMEERADSAESSVEQLEAALVEERNRIEPYPDLFADEFVVGCSEGAGPGFEVICACMVDELEKVMTLGQFLEVAVVFFDVEMDPVTGLPTDPSVLQNEGVETFFGIFNDCLFA